MEPKGTTTPARVYQEFDPASEWVTEEDCDTLLLYLPGFSKEQLRVQLRSRTLILSGERKLQQNTWSRFRKEFQVPENCDVNKINAKFEGNILFIRQPKLITPAAIEAPQNSMNAPAGLPEKTPTSITQSNGTNNVVANTKDVPQTNLEKKNVNSEGKSNQSVDPKGVCENAPQKVALANYKKAVDGFVAKLKTPKNTRNAIIVLAVSIALGVYLSNSIKSWGKFEKV